MGSRFQLYYDMGSSETHNILGKPCNTWTKLMKLLQVQGLGISRETPAITEEPRSRKQ
jgi:hypothetical protein